MKKEKAMKSTKAYNSELRLVSLAALLGIVNKHLLVRKFGSFTIIQVPGQMPVN